MVVGFTECSPQHCMAVTNGRPFGSAKQETSYNSGKESFLPKLWFYKPYEFSVDRSGKFILSYERRTLELDW